MFQFIRTDDSTPDSTSDSTRDSSHAPARNNEVGDVAALRAANALHASLNVSRLDRAGATASFLCAIHCALMPLVITMLPLLGLSFLVSEPVEWTLLAASAALGSSSLCLGFRQHRERRVFMVLGVALSFLLAGRLFHEHHFGIWGPVLMVLGGLTMMSAHLINHRLCHACKLCSSQDCH